MKKCSICGVEKPKSEFSKDKTKKDGLNTKCKSCASAMNKLWREQHREHLTQYKRDWRKSKPEKQSQYAKNERESRKSHIYTYKDKCVKCGETRPYILDFHHIENDIKEFSINSGNNKRYPIKQLELEIQKCVCLCRNCHAEFHHLYGNVPNNATEALCEYIGVNPYCVTPTRKEEIK